MVLLVAVEERVAGMIGDELDGRGGFCGDENGVLEQSSHSAPPRAQRPYKASSARSLKPRRNNMVGYGSPGALLSGNFSSCGLNAGAAGCDLTPSTDAD
jgi:hypothetical protein